MKKFITLAAMLLLAACQDAPSGYNPEPIGYNTPPIRVNAAEIRIVDSYQPPLRAPYVEQDFPVAPATAVRQWAGQHLVAAGQTGVLEVTIDDASVKEVKLPKTEGVKGLFTDDQDARYDASIHVTFRLYSGAQAMSDASGEVTVTRSRSIHEKATVDERLRFYHGITRDMMTTFNAQADARLHQYFAAFLR